MINWRTYGPIDQTTFLEELRWVNSPLLSEWDQILDVAGDHSAVVAAILAEESRYATDFNLNVPSNRNPANLRPRGGKPGYLKFTTYAECIFDLVSRITDPGYAYSGTTTLLDLIKVYAPASDSNDPEQYVRNILTRFDRWGVEPMEVPVASPVIVPRIKAKACPLEIRVLTGPMINRPALAMPDASFVSVHEVGNTDPGADEEMHADFVHNGGGENAVSFHFVVGPTKAIQLVYLNENAWHASDYYSGRGNRDSIAIETIQIGDFAATLSHLAWLIAEIYRNPTRFAFRTDVGRTDDLDPALMRERTKQHNFWAPDRKNCPQFIRDRGLWTPLLDAVAVELKPIAPAVKRYASPILPEWWSEQDVIDLRTHREDDILYRPLGTRLAAIAETGAYAHPWLPEGKGKRTRANIKAGEAVDVRFVCNHPETGKQWGISRHGTWVQMDRFTPGFTIRTRKAA